MQFTRLTNFTQLYYQGYRFDGSKHDLLSVQSEIGLMDITI